MSLIFTVVFFVFVLTTYNCIQFSDVLYIAVAALPAFMYYRRKGQLDLMLLFFNIYTLSQLGVYYLMTDNFKIGGVSADELFTIGDSTMLASEYAEYVDKSFHMLSLIAVICVYAFMQVLYFYKENSTYLKQCKDMATYTGCLRILRDRLYSFKALCYGYVILTLFINVYQFSKLQDKLCVPGVIVMVAIALMYSVIGRIVNKEWSKTVRECHDKEIEAEKSKGLQVEDLDAAE